MNLQLQKKNLYLVFVLECKCLQTIGYEETETKGLGWISGNVEKN